MKTFLIVATVFGILGSVSALADDSSSGCGLGWQVSNKMSLASSSIRTTTDTFLPNTFSMTSGTSGCAKHELVKNDEKAVLFAVNNYDSLIVEMAEGRGEYLRSFAEILGCANTDFNRFSTLTQTHYRSISTRAAETGVGLYQAVRTELLNDSSLRTSCIPQNVS